MTSRQQTIIGITALVVAVFILGYLALSSGSGTQCRDKRMILSCDANQVAVPVEGGILCRCRSWQ